MGQTDMAQGTQLGGAGHLQERSGNPLRALGVAGIQSNVGERQAHSDGPGPANRVENLPDRLFVTSTEGGNGVQRQPLIGIRAQTSSPAGQLNRFGPVALDRGDARQVHERANVIGLVAEHPLEGAARTSLRRGLAATLTRAEGGALEALAVLGRPSAELWYQATVISPFLSLAYERFLRAELLHETGRDAEALGWYGSIAERSPFELAYAAPAQLRRAEIFALQGDHEAEQAAYEQAVARWANADPELRIAAARR